MEQLNEFFAMGGHGLYVWLAYGISLVVVAANLVAPLRKRKQFLAEQARRLRRENQGS